MLKDVFSEQEFQELLMSAGHESVGFHFGEDTPNCVDWKGDWCDSGHPPTEEAHRRGLRQAHQATNQLVHFLKDWDSSIFRQSNLPNPLPTMRMAKEV
jgi:hypothetical protein